MNNEDKILEMLGGLTETVSNIQAELKDMKKEQSSIKNELKSFRVEVNQRFDSLEDKFNDLEGNNGARHIELSNEIKELRSDFTVVEVVTGKNMTDIAQLKSVK